MRKKLALVLFAICLVAALAVPFADRDSERSLVADVVWSRNVVADVIWTRNVMADVIWARNVVADVVWM